MANIATKVPYETHIAAVSLGKTPRDQLGRCINVVDHPVFSCPVCSHGGPIEVFAVAVRWLCGHTRTLPPLNIACYAGCCHNSSKRLQQRRLTLAA